MKKQELEKKIKELYAISDIIDVLVTDKQRYMRYDPATETWVPPTCEDDDENWGYNRFTILNDLITELYVKAGLKPIEK